MPWMKVKYLNYVPEFKGLKNLAVNALVEFGIRDGDIERASFALEVDLIQNKTFEGEYQPFEDIDQENAITLVTEVLGEEEIERLLLKAEILLAPLESKFYY